MGQLGGFAKLAAAREKCRDWSSFSKWGRQKFWSTADLEAKIFTKLLQSPQRHTHLDFIGASMEAAEKAGIIESTATSMLTAALPREYKYCTSFDDIMKAVSSQYHEGKERWPKTIKTAGRSQVQCSFCKKTRHLERNCRKKNRKAEVNMAEDWKRTRDFRIPAKIEGKRRSMVVDSGASVNVIPKHLAKEIIQKKKRGKDVSIKTAGGGLVGKSFQKVELEIGNIKKECDVVVFPTEEAILGRPGLKAFKAKIDAYKEKMTVRGKGLGERVRSRGETNVP
eukprot:GHVN01057473.1.p1 GENE.GHVN01057473.1~~GHVN01057473.1.p1  ORF type:complete len:281 (-),score=14.86 GHVN01057473.1:782-1624(-)